MAYYDSWQAMDYSRPQPTPYGSRNMGLQQPERPPGMRPYDQHFTLQPREQHVLDNKVKAIFMGLGWDAGCDVDGSVALFDKNHNPKDCVWWKNLKTSNGAVKHSGDDRTGEGEGDDETITVNLDQLPLDIHYLVFAVCVFTGGMNFSQVRSAYVRMVSANPSHKNHEMARYKLTGLQGTAMLLGMLTRSGAYWTFTALGSSATGRTIKDVIKDTAATNAILSMCPSREPGVRHIMLRVVKGRNLVAKDRSGLLRKKSSSDPFVKIKYKTVKLQSEVISKTLDPVWNLKPIDLGNVLESESKAVKVTVWDHDRLSGKDFMGALRLPASALFARGPGRHEWWVELTKGKKSKHQHSKVSGDLFVECTVEDVQLPGQTGILPTSAEPQGQSYPPTPQQGGPGGYPPAPQGGPGGYAPGYGYPSTPQGGPGGYPGGPPGGPGSYPGGPGAYPGGPPGGAAGYPGGAGAHPGEPQRGAGEYPGGPGGYPPAPLGGGGAYPGAYQGASAPQGGPSAYPGMGHGPAGSSPASAAPQSSPEDQRAAQQQRVPGAGLQGDAGGHPGVAPQGYPGGTRGFVGDHQGGPGGYPTQGAPPGYGPTRPGPQGGYPQWPPQSAGTTHQGAPPQQVPSAPYPGSGQMPQWGPGTGGYGDAGRPASGRASALPYPSFGAPQMPGEAAWPPQQSGGQPQQRGVAPAQGPGSYPGHPGYSGYPGAYQGHPPGGAQ